MRENRRVSKTKEGDDQSFTKQEREEVLLRPFSKRIRSHHYFIYNQLTKIELTVNLLAINNVEFVRNFSIHITNLELIKETTYKLDLLYPIALSGSALVPMFLINIVLVIWKEVLNCGNTDEIEIWSSQS